MSFKIFADLVDQRYRDMNVGELYVAETIDLYGTYLAAFPEGTNPIFRENTEHDCSCCKNFIRNIGSLVSITPGLALQTVWDLWADAPYPYNIVGKVMADTVRQAPVTTIWRTKERQYGQATSPEVREDGHVHIWHHFAGAVMSKHYSADPAKVRGEADGDIQVFGRGLNEISIDDLNTVIDLAEANNLLRGEQYLPALRAFRTMKQGYELAMDKGLFVLAHHKSPAARFRNSAIGTLLVDLAEGTELEVAVAKYENKVNGSNYKRPTALVTPKMVDSALAKLDELGLRNAATNHRHATLGDVSISDVLFVDNAVQSQMRDGLADILVTARPKAPKLDNPTPISAEEFFSKSFTTISALVENRHAGNFMSITAGEAGLFPWDNGFSWSYDGDVADSIKQRVKAAGGNVNVKFRISLSWFNTDDLDIHCHTPTGNHISFRSKQGILDVDMNAPGSVLRRDPVENLAFNSIMDGTYTIAIHQYQRRGVDNVGFELEVELDGQVQRFKYDRPVTGAIQAMGIHVQNGQIVGITLGDGVTGGTFTTDKWGVQTETLVPVDTLMLSPNFWRGQSVGNKHWFFILRDCKNPDPVRGIYNEFLRSELNEHRKVFEVLGSKTKAPYAEDQLSGLGFSSTQRNSLKVVADGRAYKVHF